MVTPTEEPIDEAYTGLQQMDPTEKKKIQRLIIAGDQVYTNFEQFQFDTGYDERADKGFLRDCNTQDRVLCAPGKLTNLNVLEGMDSLEVLWLIDQPLTSLEGIDQYKNLYEVRLCSCDELEDISPLYNIRNLQNIEIMATPVRSLNGIEKMRKLHIINICGYNMEDISALSRCDYSYAVSRGGFSLRIDWDTGISDYSFMKKIPVFSELWMCDIDPALWINELDQSKVNEITACGAFRINPECFPTLIEILKKDHPEINEIRLESNDTIKDLTGLTELPNLSNVAVSGEMTEAIKSLNGVQYRFTLEVDGVKMNSLTEELNKYGLAESDLSQISDLFICGDHLYYRKLGDKELEIPDDSFPQAKWENPDFIERMTSLGFMELRNVDAEGIPSLSDLHNLNMIWLKRCSFDNMDWLNGSEVSELYILSPRTESYQGLAGCKNLRKLQLTDSTANDISFLKELSGLMELDLSYNTGITDLSGLTELPNLKKVSISSDMEDAIKSLDGLDRKFTLTVDGTVQTKTNEEKTTQDKKSGRIITFGQ